MGKVGVCIIGDEERIDLVKVLVGPRSRAAVEKWWQWL
jgi:hypothetical protein